MSRDKKFEVLSAEVYGPLPPVNTIPVWKLHETGAGYKILHTIVTNYKDTEYFQTFDCHTSKHKYGYDFCYIKVQLELLKSFACM